jgi:hypothetical protein
MKIKSINIYNIKGISTLEKSFELLPNKVNIFVAPNGFGKSSFATAFSYLNDSKITLENNDIHNKNTSLNPIIQIEYENEEGSETLEANSNTNAIKDKFSVSVINSKLKPSGTNQRYMGRSISKYSIDIEPTILIKRVPPKSTFNYKTSDLKRLFGSNSKILFDASIYLYNQTLLRKIISEVNIHELTLARSNNPINSFIERINTFPGTSENILNLLNQEVEDFLNQNLEIKKLTEIIHNFRFTGIDSKGKSLLLAWKFIQIFKTHTATQVEKVCQYCEYIEYCKFVTQLISDFNTTRFEIKPKVENNSLVINWPKAHEISNGQRDILNFIALLLKARNDLEKENQILVIDEVFDYLDDANLISFQYFITDFIDYAIEKEINLFPILLTHLDPSFFNHFCFSDGKLKVFYLKDFAIANTANIHKLIYNRENPLIKDIVDTHFFHFHPEEIDIQNEFESLGLVKEWGDVKKFHRKIYREVNNYLDNLEYDPLAVCFALRKVIEMKAYNMIESEENKTIFLNVHGTKNKLLFAESIGVSLPENFYLLGIIYNTSLHLFNGQDITNALTNKMENLTIKRLIKEVCRP